MAQGGTAHSALPSAAAQGVRSTVLFLTMRTMRCRATSADGLFCPKQSKEGKQHREQRAAWRHVPQAHLVQQARTLLHQKAGQLRHPGACTVLWLLGVLRTNPIHPAPPTSS